MKKMIWGVVILIVIVAVAGYLYVFQKPHRDIVGATAQVSVSAEEMISDYESSQVSADSTYLDMIVAVRGRVTSEDGHTLTLNEKIFCSLDSASADAPVLVGNTVVVKGRVIGYDDLFGEIKLDNCVVDQ